MKRLSTLLLLLPMLWVSPAHSQEHSSELLGAVSRSIDNVIRPAFSDFAEVTTNYQGLLDNLCRSGEEEALSAARNNFTDLVLAFSRIEPFRFGPMQVDNRMERAFFWPDPRGRGLKQVQKILAVKDETATDPTTLSRKSVALQGLPALEFLLFGTNSAEELETPAGFRCRYAHAISQGLATMAALALSDWQAADGIAFSLQNPMETAPIYRNPVDSMQELVKAARSNLQGLNDLKLTAALRDNPAKAKPKRLPFWRSGLALLALNENMKSVKALISAWDLKILLDQNGALADQIDFEFNQAVSAIDRVEVHLTTSRSGETLVGLVKDSDHYRHLAYARLPVNSVITLLSEDLTTSLGLTIGFNALDGD